MTSSIPSSSIPSTLRILKDRAPKDIVYQTGDRDEMDGKGIGCSGYDADGKCVHKLNGAFGFLSPRYRAVDGKIWSLVTGGLASKEGVDANGRYYVAGPIDENTAIDTAAYGSNYPMQFWPSIDPKSFPIGYVEPSKENPNAPAQIRFRPQLRTVNFEPPDGWWGSEKPGATWIPLTPWVHKNGDPKYTISVETKRFGGEARYQVRHAQPCTGGRRGQVSCLPCGEQDPNDPNKCKTLLQIIPDGFSPEQALYSYDDYPIPDSWQNVLNDGSLKLARDVFACPMPAFVNKLGEASIPQNIMSSLDDNGQWVLRLDGGLQTIQSARDTPEKNFYTCDYKSGAINSIQKFNMFLDYVRDGQVAACCSENCTHVPLSSDGSLPFLQGMPDSFAANLLTNFNINFVNPKEDFCDEEVSAMLERLNNTVNSVEIRSGQHAKLRTALLNLRTDLLQKRTIPNCKAIESRKWCQEFYTLEKKLPQSSVDEICGVDCKIEPFAEDDYCSVREDATTQDTNFRKPCEGDSGRDCNTQFGPNSVPGKKYSRARISTMGRNMDVGRLLDSEFLEWVSRVKGGSRLDFQPYEANLCSTYGTVSADKKEVFTSKTCGSEDCKDLKLADDSGKTISDFAIASGALCVFPKDCSRDDVQTIRQNANTVQSLNRYWRAGEERVVTGHDLGWVVTADDEPVNVFEDSLAVFSDPIQRRAKGYQCPLPQDLIPQVAYPAAGWHRESCYCAGGEYVENNPADQRPIQLRGAQTIQGCQLKPKTMGQEFLFEWTNEDFQRIESNFEARQGEEICRMLRDGSVRLPARPIWDPSSSDTDQDPSPPEEKEPASPDPILPPTATNVRQEIEKRLIRPSDYAQVLDICQRTDAAAQPQVSAVCTAIRSDNMAAFNTACASENVSFEDFLFRKENEALMLACGS